jgi:hypothetical protein
LNEEKRFDEMAHAKWLKQNLLELEEGSDGCVKKPKLLANPCDT